ncbi:type II secretion system protein [Marinithermus hydrothermalis]|uniref:Prepilin-type N-terminal cleavage/methylation domain-containing protein n=1 Tax=Marinithermus hydrothermalis (strain DSM 14884 / JCM 11576 / T1) TaxID=869210 RepID=F2NLT6_MARHT|nr:type II secretion system protein [Marinithermus hydrothermalis]AEB10916.1 hypothetical protein Marky_0153 [Marinithermus hydrothermalis DSM 14884]
MKKTTGFTLVELAIVIVIIGVLAAVAVPRFLSTTGSAIDAQVEATASAIKSAYAIYLAENKGEKPTCNELLSSVGELTVKGDKATGTKDANLKVDCDGNPASDVYVFNPNAKTYTKKSSAYHVKFQ